MSLLRRPPAYYVGLLRRPLAYYVGLLRRPLAYHVGLLRRPPGEDGANPVLERHPEVALLRQHQRQLKRAHLQSIRYRLNCFGRNLRTKSKVGKF
jgi:hypothetical protein